MVIGRVEGPYVKPQAFNGLSLLVCDQAHNYGKRNASIMIWKKSSP